MKCSGCGTESNRKERVAASGRCPRCQLSFVLDPQDGAPFTDVTFADAIKAVSADGKLRWGVEHLYYELCRRMLGRYDRSKLPFVLGGIGTVAGFGATLGQGNLLFVLLGLALGPGIWVGRRVGRPLTAELERDHFDRIWAKWLASRPTPKGVIVRRTAPAAYRSAEPDLGDYSFDRAVICDRARTVDLLLANNFHFEHSAAVLSMDGHPKPAFDMVRGMLQKNPKLQVFVLHDASAEGERLAHRLGTDQSWFGGRMGPGGVRIVDVGIRARDAKKQRGLYVRRQSSADPALLAGASTSERAFLSEFVLELAALRPETILKGVFRAMLPATATESSDDAADWDSFG